MKYIVEMLVEDKFLHYWPMIEKQLQYVPHLWEPWWTLGSIHDFVLSGRFQCWAVGDNTTIFGVALSQVGLYPAGAVFQVILAFGEGLSDMTDEIEAAFERFAMQHSCVAAEISGRPGWGPKLRKKGFRQVGTTWMRSLTARMN